MEKTYSSDDIVMWNHVVDGSRSALGALYQKYYGLLFNFGLKYHNDEDFVKDCIHDLFVKICVSDNLSATQYVRSYLLSALKNMMFDRMLTMHISMGGKTKRAMLRLAGLVGKVGISDSYGVSA